MDSKVPLDEIKDKQLPESLNLVIEDHARPAEQILGEQDAERDANENPPAPRFVP